MNKLIKKFIICALCAMSFFSQSVYASPVYETATVISVNAFGPVSDVSHRNYYMVVISPTETSVYLNKYNSSNISGLTPDQILPYKSSYVKRITSNIAGVAESNGKGGIEAMDTFISFDTSNDGENWISAGCGYSVYRGTAYNGADVRKIIGEDIPEAQYYKITISGGYQSSETVYDYGRAKLTLDMLQTPYFSGFEAPSDLTVLILA